MLSHVWPKCQTTFLDAKVCRRHASSSAGVKHILTHQNSPRAFHAPVKCEFVSVLFFLKFLYVGLRRLPLWVMVNTLGMKTHVCRFVCAMSFLSFKFIGSHFWVFFNGVLRRDFRCDAVLLLLTVLPTLLNRSVTIKSLFVLNSLDIAVKVGTTDFAES